MNKQGIITFSAPGKVHLLGEHAVVYGKPALMTTVDLRVKTTVIPSETRNHKIKSEDSSLIAQNDIQKVIEPIVKKYLKVKTLPLYQLTINSKLPIGSGLGSSAAISATYIAALLTFLKSKWDLSLINQLTYEAEKVFHGNPSGADPATVIFGGLIWFRKETEDLKLIHQLPFYIPQKLSKNFVLINTGKPKETTKQMVAQVKNLYHKKPVLIDKFLQKQEQLTKELLEALQQKNEKRLVNIIKIGQNNLESIGAVSKSVIPIIREIESSYGAAKICGGGGKKGPTGILLCYHHNPKIIENIAKSYSLECFRVSLGVEGLRREKS